MKRPSHSLRPPMPTGIAVATVEVVARPGNADREIFATLKREGHIVARGEAIVTQSGPTQIVLQAMKPSAAFPSGTYELWLVIDRDGLLSCYPGFGDLYVHETWELHEATQVKKITDPSVWKERRLSKPTNLITIHYHRYDQDYDDVGIWTWDAHGKKSPGQNELFEVGRDDFGLIFQLDRGAYGETGDADRIGLLPRLAGDWNRKDGEDKLWMPALGSEVYLIGTRSQIWSRQPDISPHVVAAFIDAPNRLLVQLSRPVDATEVGRESVTMMDDQNGQIVPFAARPLVSHDHTTSDTIEILTFEPLDVAHRAYSIRVQNFAGSVSAVPRGVLDNAELFCDATATLGATYSPEATTFRLFAPTANAVQVVLYDSPVGNDGATRHPLRRVAKGLWEGTVCGDVKGKFYMLCLDGPDLMSNHEVVDIYSINTVNSSKRARITDLAETNPLGWEHYKDGPPLESAVDMIIYEIHVRDFTIATNSGARHRGLSLGFAEPGTHLPNEPMIKTGLDHLVELGVTHVQLMPLQDFENDETSSNYSWGYATVAFNSPDGWFATDINNDSRIREFKQLVKVLHERGIGVIMDVVYNHTGNSAPFNSLVPRYYYRVLPDGRYANGSGCGNDFRSESPMGRRYIIDSLKYWVQEYGIDGFRFDLMALIDLETMCELERELRKINPDVVLYGEPWAAGVSPIKGQPTDKNAIRGTKIGAFNDNFRDALKGWIDGPQPGFIQNGSQRDSVLRGLEGSWRDWAVAPYNSINYMTSHDNLVLYDKLKLFKPGVTDQEIKDMMKLGYLLLFTAQGVPFIHGGEEFARTKNGHSNSYNTSDEINQIDWSLKKTHYDLFTYIRDLITLRKAHPVFRIRAKEQIAKRLKFHKTEDSHILMYTLDGSRLANEPWKRVCVLVNAADSMSARFELWPGRWYVAFDHDGAVKRPYTAEGAIHVRYKSAMILCQH